MTLGCHASFAWVGCLKAPICGSGLLNSLGMGSSDRTVTGVEHCVSLGESQRRSVQLDGAELYEEHKDEWPVSLVTSLISEIETEPLIACHNL